jgi:hypothetical protein
VLLAALAAEKPFHEPADRWNEFGQKAAADSEIGRWVRVKSNVDSIHARRRNLEQFSE